MSSERKWSLNNSETRINITNWRKSCSWWSKPRQKTRLLRLRPHITQSPSIMLQFNLVIKDEVVQSIAVSRATALFSSEFPVKLSCKNLHAWAWCRTNTWTRRVKYPHDCVRDPGTNTWTLTCNIFTRERRGPVSPPWAPREPIIEIDVHNVMPLNWHQKISVNLQ